MLWVKHKSTIKYSVWNIACKIIEQKIFFYYGYRWFGLAEAKSNLPSLKDNQAYANMSVDVLTTTKGMPTSGGINIQESYS